MPNDFDLQSHRDIWNGFLKLVWYAGGATVITLILMAYFLV